MIEALDSKVLELVRTSIGPIAIGNLEIGKFRELTPGELESLKRAAGSSPHP
jgi:16S rRNA U516 pseudouridylate synthase RsuA-like enzyme